MQANFRVGMFGSFEAIVSRKNSTIGHLSTQRHLIGRDLRLCWEIYPTHQMVLAGRQLWLYTM